MKYRSKLLLIFNISLIAVATLYLFARPLITALGICGYLTVYCKLATKLLYNNFALALLIVGFSYASFRAVSGHIRKRQYLNGMFYAYEDNIGKLDSALISLNKKYKLYIADSEEPTAFSSGIINKSIYLSTGIIENLNEKELTALLNHETAHLKNNDLIHLSLARFLSNLFFFVPGIVALYRRLEAQTEFQADFEAAKSTGVETVVNAILKIVHFKIHHTYAVAYFADNRTDALRRINKLEGRTVGHRLSMTALCLTIVSLLALSALTATAGATVKVGPTCRMHNTNVSINHLR